VSWQGVSKYWVYKQFIKKKVLSSSGKGAHSMNRDDLQLSLKDKFGENLKKSGVPI
jgi:hypothetical protein